MAHNQEYAQLVEHAQQLFPTCGNSFRRALTEACKQHPELAKVAVDQQGRNVAETQATHQGPSLADLARKRIAEAAGEPVSVTRRPRSLADLMLQRVPQPKASGGQQSTADLMRRKFENEEDE